MATKQLFNAKTQQVEDAELTVDANNEIVATFADGCVLKFPAGLTDKQFEKLVEKHQSGNEGQEVITAEMEAERDKERSASFALIGEVDPATEQSDESDAQEGEETPQE